MNLQLSPLKKWSRVHWSFWAPLLLSFGNTACAEGTETQPNSKASTHKALLPVNETSIEGLCKDLKAFYQALGFSSLLGNSNRASVKWVPGKISSSPPRARPNLPFSLEFERYDFSNSSLRLQTPLMPNVLVSYISNGIFELYTLGDYQGSQDFRPLIELLQKKLEVEGTKAHAAFLHALGIALLEPHIQNACRSLTLNPKREPKEALQSFLEILEQAPDLKDFEGLQSALSGWLGWGKAPLTLPPGLFMSSELQQREGSACLTMSFGCSEHDGYQLNLQMSTPISEIEAKSAKPLQAGSSKPGLQLELHLKIPGTLANDVKLKGWLLFKL